MFFIAVAGAAFSRYQPPPCPHSFYLFLTICSFLFHLPGRVPKAKRVERVGGGSVCVSESDCRVFYYVKSGSNLVDREGGCQSGESMGC